MPYESTTPDLVELTRGLIDATNRGDVDALMSFYGPHPIWESPPLGTSFEGVATIRDFFEDWIGTYEDFEMRSEQVLDLGAGVVFAVIRQNGRPAGGTGRVQTRMAVTSQWANGKIVRATVNYGIDKARAAAERLAEKRGGMAKESTTADLAVLVQRIVDAANARDLDAAMSCYLPGGVYDMSPVGLGIRQGHAALREHFQEWWDGYEEYAHELEEMRVTGEGVAFCVLAQRGRLPGSTSSVQLRYPAVVTVRDRLIERITVYGDIDEYRAAAERLAEERG